MLSRVEGTAALDEGVTVVVPVLNEAENPQALIGEIVLAANRSPIREIVYVDDGSADETLPAWRRSCAMFRCFVSSITTVRSASRHSCPARAPAPRSAGVHGRRFAERPG